mmetsp:Transcript_17168/g.52155  ORF Transcript_17168/g.52155 Transcript_17168/m.52155 type:complete len:133 (+) Transcript_17168:359-757(+)
MERNDEALVLYRQIYARRVEKEGVSHLATITSALSLAVALGSLKHWDEAISLLRDQLPVAWRSLGVDHHLTLLNKITLAAGVTADPERTREDLLEADIMVQDVLKRRRRILGPAHEDTLKAESVLSGLRKFL